MKVKELIHELQAYNPEMDVEICCYVSIGDPKKMVILKNSVDGKGRTPCQINTEIIDVGLSKDKHTVYVS